MNDIDTITKALIDFRNERDWEQFHNPKDLALALSIEAAELNEIFLWKSSSEGDVERIKEELADVLAYSFMIAHRFNLDIKEIMMDKIKKNGEKYPVEKSRGNALKYNKL
ncbi:MAG: nucleotide pyrophosphohydrolase [Bacteroidales bacterium]|nr:nucleotide pyrophosphohydrolase [Bacteroidales bacterium]